MRRYTDRHLLTFLFSFIDRSNASWRFRSVRTDARRRSFAVSVDGPVRWRNDSPARQTRLACAHGEYVHGLYNVRPDDRPWRYPRWIKLSAKPEMYALKSGFSLGFWWVGRIEQKSLDRSVLCLRADVAKIAKTSLMVMELITSQYSKKSLQDAHQQTR